MSPNFEYYEWLETQLRTLLATVRNLLPSEGAAEVEEFIDHAEYGIALESMCWMIVEEGITISLCESQKMYRLADVMGIGSEISACMAGR